MGNVVINVYPKVGSTWVRLVLSNIIANAGKSYVYWRPVYLDEVNKFIPETMSDPEIPIVRTHRKHTDFIDLEIAYPKMLNIVRNPMDVMISFFHYTFHGLSKQFWQIPEGTSISEFIRNTARWHKYVDIGIKGYVDHVESYKTFKGERMLVKYEDMVGSPHKSMVDIADFCGWGCNEKLMAWCVEAASIGKIRKEEIRKKIESGQDPNHLFTRSGKVGQGEMYLMLEDREYIMDNLRGTLKEMYA